MRTAKKILKSGKIRNTCSEKHHVHESCGRVGTNRSQSFRDDDDDKYYDDDDDEGRTRRRNNER